MTIAGWVLGALPCVLLLFSATMKFVKPDGFAAGMEKMGVPLSHANGLGVLEICCTLLYLFPRTAVLGAILLTGYMGGAIQTHLRVGDSFVPQIFVGVLLWLGLYLRDARLRAILPLR